jgi:hypothetical protein
MAPPKSISVEESLRSLMGRLFSMEKISYFFIIVAINMPKEISSVSTS